MDNRTQLRLVRTPPPSVTRTHLPTPDAIIVMGPDGLHIVADHRVSTSDIDAITTLAVSVAGGAR